MPGKNEKQLVIDVVANLENVTKQFESLVQRVENNKIIINIDANTKNIQEQTKIISKSFAKSIKDIKSGTNGIEFTNIENALIDIISSMKEVNKTITTLDANLRNRGDFQSFANSIDKLDNSVQRLFSHFDWGSVRTPESVKKDIQLTISEIDELNKKEQEISKTANSIKRAFSGIDLSGDVLSFINGMDGEALSRGISKIREFIELGGDINKLQLGGESFKKLLPFLDLDIDSKIESNDRKLQAAQQRRTRLLTELERAEQKAAIGNVKVNLDQETINQLIEGLNGVVDRLNNVTKSIDIDTEDLQQDLNDKKPVNITLHGEIEKDFHTNVQNQINELPEFEIKLKPVIDFGTDIDEKKLETRQANEQSAQQKVIHRSQEDIRSDIEHTNRVIKTQNDWLSETAIVEKDFKTSGKKEANEQLREWTNRLRHYRSNPEAFHGTGTLDRDKIYVGWYRAYKEAERQGSARSVLNQNSTDISERKYQDALNNLINDRNRAKQFLAEATQDLQKYQQEMQNALSATPTNEPVTDNKDVASFVNNFINNLEKSIPVLQEKINESFSKIDLGDGALSEIGKQIVDSMISGINDGQSTDSFTKNLETFINDAFKNIIIDAGIKELILKIQESLDNNTESAPFKLNNFDAKTDNLVVSIQNALDNETFNINIGGTIQELATALDTSADNVRTSFLDAIKWMREADAWQHKEGTKLRERQLYYNTKTGQFSNPAIIGNDRSTPPYLKMVEDYKDKGIVFDTDLHTHLFDSYAFPSSLGNASTRGIGDIDIFFKSAYNSAINGVYETISKFVVGAQKEYAEFDFSKIASSAQELEDFLSNWISENFDEIKKVVGNKASDLVGNPRELAGLYVGKKLISSAQQKYDYDYYTPGRFVDSILHNIFSDYEDNGTLYNHSTGKNQTIQDIFKKGSKLTSIIKTKDVKTDLFQEFANKLLDKIRAHIQEAANNGQNIDANAINAVVDEALKTTLSDNKFSKLNNFKEDVKNVFSSFFKDQFAKRDYHTRSYGKTWDQAGSEALHELIKTDDLIGRIVQYYTPEELEAKYGKNFINKNRSTNHDQSTSAPALSEDFHQQLQNAIDESGQYIIKVCGELIDDFKSQLQQEIDKLEAVSIKTEGKLIETFKDDLQELINNIGPFKIEVKPDMDNKENAESQNTKKGGNTSSDKDEEYNEEDAKKQAAAVEQEINKQREAFNGYITNVDRMYDSHDHLVQAIISAERTIQDENGKLVQQTERLNIRFNKKNKIAYTSKMDSDNYKATDKKNDQERKKALEDYYRALEREYQIEEKIQKLRNQKKNNEANAYQQMLNQNALKEKENQLNEAGYALEQDKLDLLKKEHEQRLKIISGANNDNAIEKSIARKERDDNKKKTKNEQDKKKAVNEYINALKQQYKLQEQISRDNGTKKQSNADILQSLFRKTDGDTERLYKAKSNLSNYGIKASDVFTEELTKTHDVTMKLIEADKKRVNAEKEVANREKENKKYTTEQTLAINEYLATLKEYYEYMLKIRSLHINGDSAGATEAAKYLMNNIMPRLNSQNQTIRDKKYQYSEKQSQQRAKLNSDYNIQQNRQNSLLLDKTVQKYQQLQRAKVLLEKNALSDDSTQEDKERYEKISALVGKLGTKYEDLVRRVKEANLEFTEAQNLAMSSAESSAKQQIDNIDKKKQKGVDPERDARNKSIKEYMSLLKEEAVLKAEIDVLKDSGNYEKEIAIRQAQIEAIQQQSQAYESLNLTEEESKRITLEVEQAKRDASIKTVDAMKSEGMSEEKMIKKALSLRQQLTQWLNSNPKAQAKYGEFISSALKELNSEASITPERLNEIEREFREIRIAATAAGDTGKKFGDILKQRWASLGAYLGSFVSFYQVIGRIKEMINSLHELDDALTEMRKVSDESISTLKAFQEESFAIADTVGSTAKVIQDSTADWMRLGESLNEAKESAKDASILLNVSEFSSIDEATTSLVAMSQAYSDMEKIDIIDKLNNIGNNFSISTDQLATGLQNAAAVLKTQGNDIDESIALLTAANSIVQDISKASTGIRTIALRIAGTETAKQELEELGESVDDYIVQTSSKTQATIKAYTAVASNAGKGIDVLDANGNLRDTYDILLDISKVYKEIQEEDKKAGTNRAKALVEYIAGKNRSNIAASILENPDLLEKVYKSSQDSVGSAMEENEKYLDSISGHIAKLQNQLQQLYSDTLSSGFVKGTLDVLTNLVKIVDQVGLLKTGLIAIGTIVGSKKLGYCVSSRLRYKKFAVAIL